jgi:cobalt/nickel transport system permease protein
MADIERAARELREMDELARQGSPVHALHPLAKLAVTVAYILITLSFGRYSIGALFPMILYPAFMFSLSGISPLDCARKLRVMLVMVCAVGLFDPLLNRQIMLSLGSLNVSYGTVSMITLMLKGVFCLSASFILAATTPIDSICGALRMIRVPDLIVRLLLLTFRYVSVMVDEVAVMTTAYKLRAPGQKGVHFSAWGSFLGQLLLRSMDRAQDLYDAMLLRGFRGEFPYADIKKAGAGDVLFVLACLLCFIFLRKVNVGDMIGGLIV